MNRTNYTKTISIFLVLAVLLFGNQAGIQLLAQNKIGPSAQGVVSAESGSTIFLPIISGQNQNSPTSGQANLRVNAPYFPVEFLYEQTAILWFGQVTSTDNYADVRIAYNNQELFINLNAFDRLLWFNGDSASAPGTLTDWDGITLYLNTGSASARQPAGGSFRFSSQWSPEDPSPAAYHAAFRGDGQTWRPASLSFTSNNTWRGFGGYNNNKTSEGWGITLHIPFTSLGLSGPPAQGTVWSIALDMYDRDGQNSAPNPVKTWPPDGRSGQLGFGLPKYTPSPVSSTSTPITIRQGLNGQTVKDAMVGGGSVCGDGLDRWTQWGMKNWYGTPYFNVQNQGDYADFPCFSKEYLSFPLQSIPKGKVIVSAKLTITLFGNSDPSGAQDSYIQVMRAAADWDPTKVSWNTAPPAQENYTGLIVHPTNNMSGVRVPYTFDVTRAAADAYREGIPLRMVLYDTDWPMHSGKYFFSSYSDDWGGEIRPALQVTWGDPK